jgi:hypothetical protein
MYTAWQAVSHAAAMRVTARCSVVLCGVRETLNVVCYACTCFPLEIECCTSCCSNCVMLVQRWTACRARMHATVQVAVPHCLKQVEAAGSVASEARSGGSSCVLGMPACVLPTCCHSSAVPAYVQGWKRRVRRLQTLTNVSCSAGAKHML